MWWLKKEIKKKKEKKRKYRKIEIRNKPEQVIGGFRKIMGGISQN